MGWVRVWALRAGCAIALMCSIGAACADALPKADHILIVKAERRLMLMRGGLVLKSYPIALGQNPVGPKLRQGDLRTPEGRYVIDRRNGASKYHLALHISYPNAADVARAQMAGVPTGGDIMIHGLPPRFGVYDPPVFYKDWTEGCVAVANPAMDEIWALVDDGISVEIRP